MRTHIARLADSETGKRAREIVREATPRLHKSQNAPTVRDYTTGGLGAAVTVLLVAALHHGAQIDLSPEVVAALTTVVGFGTARVFRY